MPDNVTVKVKGRDFSIPPSKLEQLETEFNDRDISYTVAVPAGSEAVAGLQERGTPFESVMPTQFIEGDPDAMVPMAPPGGDADVGLEMEAMEEAQTQDRFTMAVAQRGLNQRPDTFLPPGREGLLGMPASDAYPIEAYVHYEPSLGKVAASLTDEDEKAELEDLGTDSEVYKRWADHHYSQVFDVYQKHGQPVIRGAKVGGASGAMHDVTKNISLPVMIGWDMMKTLGAGRELMSAAVDKIPSAADEELVRTGVLSKASERIREHTEDSYLASFVGGLAGARGGVATAVSRAGGALSGMMGGGRLATVGGGAAAAAGEALGEEAVESASEELRDVPRTPMSGTELMMRGGMGGLASVAASGAGKLADMAKQRLRSPDIAGGAELRQLESLTGELGTRKGGTGYQASPVVEEALRRDSAAAAAGEVVDAVDTLKHSTAKDVGEALGKRIDKTAQDQLSQAERFYASNEGSKVFQRVDSLRDLMKDELGRRKLTGTRKGAAEVDAPLVDTTQLKKAMKDFEGIDQLNARDLDVILKGIDDTVLKNRRLGQSNKFLKSLQREMREIRDQFEGNVGTDGRSWGKVKSDQGDAINALDNARRRLGQNIAEDGLDLDNIDNLTALVNSMETLGVSPARDKALFDQLTPDLLKDLEGVNPELLKQLKHAASLFPRTKLSGMKTEMPVHSSAILRTAAHVIPTRMDPFMDFVRSGLYKRGAEAGVASGVGGATMGEELGSGSERAEAYIADEWSKLDMLKQLSIQAQNQPEKDE